MHVCNLGYMFLSIWFHKAIKIQLFTTCEEKSEGKQSQVRLLFWES
uniref:At5g08185 n=1 Tax=Arabidopsis thaliana TaxID=3702 RepID=Q8VZ98_ARATH|nr:unknown protein [Arabidopsis thaliana]AAP21310.1 At5g08185 [Arabidopsis thaliana]